MSFHPPTAAPMLNKVPEVTLAFWVIKIMSTTVGETGADYLAVHVGLGTAVTSGIMAALLAATFALWYGRERTGTVQTLGGVTLPSPIAGLNWVSIPTAGRR